MIIAKSAVKFLHGWISGFCTVATSAFSFKAKDKAQLIKSSEGEAIHFLSLGQYVRVCLAIE